MTTPTAAEPAEPRYTQGIMGDGAAILDDGVLLTVEQILDRLNAAATAPPAPDNIVALVDAYGAAEYWTHQMENDSNARIARDALLAAIGRMGGAAVPEELVRLSPPEGRTFTISSSPQHDANTSFAHICMHFVRDQIARQSASPAPAHVPKSVALHDVVPLADAMWQLLDDMGADGLSVCPAAKAAARLAYEPFADADVPLEYTAAAARAVALSSTATEPSSGALPEATAADGLMGRLGRLPIVDLGIAWPDRSPPKDPSTHTEPSPDALCKAGGRLCSTHQQRAYLRHYANEQPIGSGPWTLLLVVLNDLEATLTGVDGAAKQASLCDLIEPAKRLRSERDAAEARAQAAEAEAGRLREAFQDLESTASRVAWFGPITGPHWPPLSTALVKARAALAPQGSEAAEQGDRG